MRSLEIQGISHPRSTKVDRYPLSLDSLRVFPHHILIDKHVDSKTADTRLQRFYMLGTNAYAKRKQIFMDLPDKRLWPEKYAPAYNWMEEAYSALKSTPEMIFHELIKNADMHGNGFRGATAAWVNPSTFIFRIADQGKGFGTSTEQGDGIGWMFIGNFATDSVRNKVQKNGHILGICRNLDKAQLPQAVDPFEETDITKDIAYIRKLRSEGLRLPSIDPNSETHTVFDSKLGKWGGYRILNALGKEIDVNVLETEPDPWF